LVVLVVGKGLGALRGGLEPLAEVDSALASVTGVLAGALIPDADGDVPTFGHGEARATLGVLLAEKAILDVAILHRPGAIGVFFAGHVERGQTLGAVALRQAADLFNDLGQIVLFIDLNFDFFASVIHGHDAVGGKTCAVVGDLHDRGPGVVLGEGFPVVALPFPGSGAVECDSVFTRSSRDLKASGGHDLLGVDHPLLEVCVPAVRHDVIRW